MEWQSQLNDDPLPWLLESNDPGARYLALRDLVGLLPDNPDLVEAQKAAHAYGPIASFLAEMHPKGYWIKPGPGYNPKYFSIVWSLTALAQLGASARLDMRIAQACAYLLEKNLTPYGQFSHNGSPSGTIDCLQGNLCAALVALGCEDPRLEKAFEWMARTVIGEGIAQAVQDHAGLLLFAKRTAHSIDQARHSEGGGFLLQHRPVPGKISYSHRF
jgi:hypothetical protein